MKVRLALLAVLDNEDSLSSWDAGHATHQQLLTFLSDDMNKLFNDTLYGQHGVGFKHLETVGP
jgi:hypothetical protein